MLIEKQDFSFDFKTDSDNSGPLKMPTFYTLMGSSKAGKPQPPNSILPKISKSAHVNGSVDDAMEWLQQLYIFFRLLLRMISNKGSLLLPNYNFEIWILCGKQARKR